MPNVKLAYFSLITLVGLLFYLTQGFSFQNHSLIASEFENAGHTLFFAFFSAVTYFLSASLGFRSPKKAIVFIALFGAGLGILTEYLQSFTSRDPDINDLIRDLEGLVIGLCLVGMVQRKLTHLVKMLLLVLFLIMVAVSFDKFATLALDTWQRDKAFPVLFDANKAWYEKFIEENSSRITIENNGGLSGLLISTRTHSTYSGINYIEPYRDWTGYSTLYIEILSLEKDAFDLTLRVQDRSHNQQFNDRFNQRFLVKPGVNQFEVPLKRIEAAPVRREMDLEDIASMGLFVARPQKELKFVLRDIQLR